MAFDLSNYEEVKDRIPRFWADHPKGGIRTQRLEAPAGEWVVLAALYREGESEPFATGLAHEITGTRGVNATSALENCETSAIGRALANAGYGAGSNRPSREEMQKAARGPKSGSTAPQPPASVSDASLKAEALRDIVAAYPGISEGEAKRLAAKHWPEATENGLAGSVGRLLALVAADPERPMI